MSIQSEVQVILGDVLQIGNRVEELELNSSLLGSIPEFDSMAVVSVITQLEDIFGFIVDDDEISADTFETLGSLCEFVDSKIG